MKPTVLVAEDQGDEEFFFAYALWKSGLPIELRLVKNGEETIRYLEGLKPYEDRKKYPSPALLIIDLSLPGIERFETVASRQGAAPFDSLPVVVLSESDRNLEWARTKLQTAADYLIKPSTMDGLVQLLKFLHQRWVV
jgi:CheY-like chemotaxis protein